MIIKTLLSPRLLSFKNRLRRAGLIRYLFFLGIGAGLWAGVFAAAFQVLAYFRSIDQLGEILAFKLLSMIFVIMLSLLIFSSIITILSKLYLSRDLDLVHALPVPARLIYLARWLESTVDSAWMVVIFALPVFIAFGLVYGGGPLFYLATGVCLLSLCLTASALSALAVTLAVNLIAARRLRTLFVLLGIALFVVLYIAFRLLRPERLVDPEMFATALIYLKTLQTPAPPWLPSTWAFDCTRAALSGHIGATIQNGLLSVSFSAMLIFLMLILADKIYFSGFSKTVAGRTDATRRQPARLNDRWLFFLPAPARAFITKEVKTFWRDQTQWTQIFLIGALIVIYVYNFKVLPLEKAPIQEIYLQNLFAFLNLGLAAFVLIAVAGRFAFPAVSLEKGAFWLTQSAPVSLGTFLRLKFLVYLVPLAALSLVLILVTNIFLRVSPFMMGLSLTTMLFLVPTVVALAVGLGAAYPDFASENPAQAVTSFGGFVFMATAALYVLTIIVLEAGPTYRIFMAGLHRTALSFWEWAWIGGCFGLGAILSVGIVIAVLAWGERRLQTNA